MTIRVPEMPGRTARWYARRRGAAAQMREYRHLAARLTAASTFGRCDISTEGVSVEVRPAA